MKKPHTLFLTSLGLLAGAFTLKAQDLPAVSVSSSPTDESLLAIDITVSLSSPAAGGESFVPSVAEGTASVIDFEPLRDRPIVFAAGATSTTITVLLIDDAIPELDETFELVLSQPSGLTIANPISTHTILSEDTGILLPSFFSDGMVLQRNKAAAFWGFALPGSPVTVQFAGQTLQATADSNSRFEVTFNNLAGSSVGRNLMVSSQGVTQTISDVVVGEVWMGAGQSNMDFPLNFLPSPENDNVIATANDPLLRIFVPVETARRDPQVLVDGDWLFATPGDIPSFSALAYYYGARLREELGVPIAILENAIGGQPIEGFISNEKLQTFQEGLDALATKDFFYGLFEQALDDFDVELAEFEANPVGDPPVFTEEDPQFAFNLAGQIYNGMINPIVGYGMRGILWYQGEANTFFFATSDYAPLLQGLAEDYRTRWNDDLPFYYHQLPNFVDTNRPLWVDVQDAQRRALDLIPNSGMVVGNDIGDPNDIHPINKSDFADRLVLWPLANEYGQSGLVTSGPLYFDSFIDGSSVVVQFDFSQGLTTRDGLAPGSFELMEAGGTWVPATAVIQGQTVVVSAVGISEPTRIRYAFEQNPTEANLVNSAGLPASIFEEAPQGVGVIALTTSASPTNEGLIGLPVTFTLSSPAIGGERFNFSLPSGTAIAGEDYIDFIGGGVVEFTPGQTTETIVLTLIDDNIFETDETFSFAITQPVGISVAQPNIILTILNDDEPNSPELPSLTISASPTNEGLIGLPVTFNLDSPAVGGERFNFALASGTAIADEDFIDWTGGLVVFETGQTSQTLVLTVIDDTIVEDDETFSINLTNPANLNLAQTSLTLTIANDDEGPISQNPPVVTVTASASPTKEGLIGFPVTFNLDSPAVGGEQFNFSLVSGTAIADEDFIDWTGGIVVFEAGETSQTLVLSLIDDTLVEEDETFSIEFTNPVDLELAQSSLGLTILNDDVPSSSDLAILTVTANPTNEGLIGYPVVFTLSRPAVGDESLNFDLAPGVEGSSLPSANPFEDYLPFEGGRIEFAPGETSQTLILTLVDDSVIEPNEDFTINLSNFSGLTVGDTSIRLTILNDDSVLDDYGSRFGLPVEQRAIASDDDNDGVGFFLEYAFNLNPTVTATPNYIPGQSLPNGEPFGLPRIFSEIDPGTGVTVMKYQFVRRTNSFPKVTYITEISANGLNFVPAEPDEVVGIGEFFEEVTVIMGNSASGPRSCFARVRVEVEDDNGDGF